MLSHLETNGLREILNCLDDKELFSVYETVTKKLLASNSRQEATENILACTRKPSDLLRRQKITKKILFSYLLKKTFVQADYGKSNLIGKCLELWKSTESFDETDCTEVENQGNFDVRQRSGTEALMDESLMGVKFSQWFFGILNTLDGFGPEHFFTTCILSSELQTIYDQQEVSVSGANDVATFLANLVLIHKFNFQPNESSIKLDREEIHGLVRIIIHGVLHQNSGCIGLFNSAFGLAKQPDCPYTYKIQMIQVKLQVNLSTQRMLPGNG